VSTKTIEITTQPGLRDMLLSLLEADTELILTEDGEALARVTLVKKFSREQLAGLHRGSMTLHDDFDEPLPDSFWFGDES
jgi:antitoxin (DNA-binding transcriptional repressor) of toxin-antitoxin stability system